MEDITHDLFLNGRLTIAQPRTGFRAGVDSVFLGAAVPAVAGQSVLELGCGVGTASFCLASRVPGLTLTGLEIQPGYANLARRNAERNSIPLDVVEGDLANPPGSIRDLNVDHVFANPPYYERSRGTSASDAGRETAFADGAPLATWVDAAVRRLRPRGCLTFIQKIERLPELLAAMDARVGRIEVLPLSPRQNARPRLFLLRARKGARAPFALLPPLIIHEGVRHERDGESYRPEIASVLREGTAIPWPEQ